MSKIGNATLLAFQGELAKMAAPSSVLGTAGALGGVGLGAGALLGAGVGGVRKYQQAREEGLTRGQALRAGFSGAVSGGGKGAIAGGALGLAGGGALGHFSPGAGDSIRQTLNATGGPAGSFSRFGQRQVHGLTGYAEGHLGEIRHGAWAKQQAEEAAKKHLDSVRAGAVAPGRLESGVNKLLGRTPVDAAEKQLQQAVKAREVAEKAEQMGLTSVPGYLKSLGTNGVGATLGTAGADFWHSADPLTKAMTVAGGAGVVREAVRSEDPEHEGRGRLRRVGGKLRDVATLGLLSPLPMGTQMGLSSVVKRPEKRNAKVNTARPLQQDLSGASGQVLAPGELS